VNHAHTRPLILGYVRLRLLASDADVAATRDQLNAFAHREGYSLEMIFFEQAHLAPAAFEALIEAVKLYEAGAVVVPDLRHLEVIGAPPALKDFVVRATGVPVLEAALLPLRKSSR